MNNLKFWLIVHFVGGTMFGFIVGHALVPGFDKIISESEPCEPCSEMDTDEQALSLMFECKRCKDKEAKNWEVAMQKRWDELYKCWRRCGPTGPEERQ